MMFRVPPAAVPAALEAPVEAAVDAAVELEPPQAVSCGYACCCQKAAARNTTIESHNIFSPL